MTKLIIHVGPGKCGSSSIQTFFTKYENPCIEKIKFILIDPNEIKKVNQVNPPGESITYFKRMILNGFKDHDVVILSQEFFIQCPLAVKNICELLYNQISTTFIIGYSRNQSGFVLSAYAQWFFRSKERVKEINEAVVDLGINPIYFKGSEKLLIAAITNDFYSARQLSGVLILDWNNTYLAFEQQEMLANKVTIKCGVLPSRNADKNLIEDFADKANINLKKEFYKESNLKENERFNEHLIEATYIAAELGFDVPPPDDSNDYLLGISKVMKSTTTPNSEFLNLLKQYIDHYFYESNLKFCKKYELNSEYFGNTTPISKEEILAIIKNEQMEREKTLDPVKIYKEVIGVITEASFNFKNKNLLDETQVTVENVKKKSIFKKISELINR